MSIKERRKRASADSQKGEYGAEYRGRVVVPEDDLRNLALGLSVRDAHKAALCLLVIDIAARAIAKNKTNNGELNLRLIRQVTGDETCKPIRRLTQAIIDALEQGAGAAEAASLTITCFLEFVFEYAPSRNMAESLYNRKLNKIRRAS